jgi:predicted RNA-binding Zn-ribbon protein involved in translation (DUF1610 family)
MEDKNTIKCVNCGAELKFSPGTVNLKCEFCDAENIIEVDEQARQEAFEELDYHSYLQNAVAEEETLEVTTVKCTNCGAKTNFDPNLVSDHCEFCGSPLLSEATEKASLIKPRGVLPFVISEKEGTELYKKWLKKLWFAPNKLKKYARQTEPLDGIYVPYWTYDSNTYTKYTGQRGDDYTETETYSDNGETKTRTVTKTRWTFVSGNVSRFFDDVMVPAADSLPRKYVDRLEPWDLSALQGYDTSFFRGFKAETYQVNLEAGFEIAEKKMEYIIRQDIRRDIGGDKQRISSLTTKHSDITFKHIMLPIWISAYRYKDKSYRFLVNGQTGKVQGERPWSWIKITLAVLAALAVIGGIYWFVEYYQ